MNEQIKKLEKEYKKDKKTIINDLKSWLTTFDNSNDFMTIEEKQEENYEAGEQALNEFHRYFNRCIADLNSETKLNKHDFEFIKFHLEQINNYCFIDEM